MRCHSWFDRLTTNELPGRYPSTCIIKYGTVACRIPVITSSTAGCPHEACEDSYRSAEYNMQLSRTSNGLTYPMTAIGYGSACALSHLRHQTGLKQNHYIELLIEGLSDL